MTTAVLAHRVVVPAYGEGPRVEIRFRLLRDGEVTPGLKAIRVYRSWLGVNQLDAVFQAEDGEFTAIQRFDPAALLAQGEWLVCGADDLPPRRTRATYLALAESGTYTFNITEPFDRHALGGNGLLSGSFPLSMITQNGNLPSQSEIRILYRPNTGEPGDGILVGTTTCNADGTWQVSGLDENLKFDIVARIPGYNDVLISDVQPVTP